MRKKIISIISAIAILSYVFAPYAVRKAEAVLDTPVNTYTGIINAQEILDNSKYEDVEPGYWGREPIMRMTALGITKGTGTGEVKFFSPLMEVTNEQALALIVRIVRSEDEAKREAENIELTNKYGEDVLKYWSRGYLAIAMDMGLISEENLTDAFYEPLYDENGNEIEVELTFNREEPASREQVAQWLVKAIGDVRPELIAPIYRNENIFQYEDWEEITPSFTPYIEAVIQADIMIGFNHMWRPKDAIIRSEMMQLLKNADDVLYNTMGLVRKSGYVERIIEETGYAGTDTYRRRIQIRNSEGFLEDIAFDYSITQYGRDIEYDVPTYLVGNYYTLEDIETGFEVEYIVNEETKQAVYIYIDEYASKDNYKGVLQPLNDLANGKITIRTDEMKYFTYTLSRAVYIPETEQLKIDVSFYNKADVPIGKYYKLTLRDDIVVEIQPYATVYPSEYGGVVKEIDTKFSYITIMSWDTQQEKTFQFNTNKVIVEKQNYYSDGSGLGYFDEIFDTNLYDASDASIEDIEVGDIAYLKTDGSTVTHISAKTNYIMKYGVIKSIEFTDSATYNFVLELEDGTLAYYNIDSDIVVKADNEMVSPMTLQQGDWVKLLVNESILGEGYVYESVKQILIDKYKNTVKNIYKGHIGTYSQIQKMLTLQGAYTLEKIGWADYTLSNSIMVEDTVETYYNGKPIAFAEAVKLYNGTGFNAYVATEKYFDKEKIVKITITNTADTVLDKDNVIYSDGGSTLKLISKDNDISINKGAIVVRNDRLVTADSVIVPDYVQIVNGASQGAVIVNVIEPISNSKITVSRGRIKDITDLYSMKLSSQAILQGMKWVYSPIERVYQIDPNTVIVTDGGEITLEEFKTYGPDTQYEEVFNIISEGTRAKYIVQSPYCKQGVTGTVYSANGTSLMLKDVSVYDETTGNFNPLSLTNNYGEISLQANAVIIKNNEAITADKLEVGDKLRVLSTENMAENLQMSASRTIPGYIVLVEE